MSRIARLDRKAMVALDRTCSRSVYFLANCFQQSLMTKLMLISALELEPSPEIIFKFQVREFQISCEDSNLKAETSI